MLYIVEPRILDLIADDRQSYDPDVDWITIIGAQPHSPNAQHARDMGDPCPSCGFRLNELIVRKRAIAQDGVTIAKSRRGLVVCVDCCQASLDDRVSYPGLPVGAAMDIHYKTDDDEAREAAKLNDLAEPTKYEGEAMRRRVLTRREKREAKQAEKRERKVVGNDQS